MHPTSLLFARHGRVHKPFQISSRMFEIFLSSLVLQIDNVNSSHSRNNVQLQFFFCPFLFFTRVSLSVLRDMMSGSRLNFVNLWLDHMDYLGCFSFNSEFCDSFPGI